MAKRGRRKTGTLATLERQLHKLNRERHRIVSEITAAFEHLTAGHAAPDIAHGAALGALGVKTARGAKSTTRKRSTMSAAGRARISAAQKKRWAAKKAAEKKASAKADTRRRAGASA